MAKERNRLAVVAFCTAMGAEQTAVDEWTFELRQGRRHFVLLLEDFEDVDTPDGLAQLLTVAVEAGAIDPWVLGRISDLKDEESKNVDYLLLRLAEEKRDRDQEREASASD